ncbi:MAG: sulfite reductase subunit alpha [Limisphaera sp.]
MSVRPVSELLDQKPGAVAMAGTPGGKSESAWMGSTLPDGSGVDRPASRPGATTVSRPPLRWVPVIPESAPFTAEQRAWLNGFLAGLFSYVPVTEPVPQAPERSLRPLTILFGSQTGNAERLARRAAREASRQGFVPRVHDMAQYDVSQLAREENLLVITSTYGDGEPPDNAKGFWEALRRETAPSLTGVRFSVCALGDRNYPRFCQFGRDLDARLERLGARRVAPRQDCDVDFEEPFAQWLQAALNALLRNPGAAPPGLRDAPRPPHEEVQSAAPKDVAGEPSPAEGSRYNRRNPFPARLIENRRLSGPASAKEVRHFVVSLEGSGMTYACGDALGVYPTNDPALVEALLQWLGSDGEDPVPGPDGQVVPVRLALLKHYDIARPSDKWMALLRERAKDNGACAELLRPGNNGVSGDGSCWHLLDLIEKCPNLGLTPAELVMCLRPLQPRLYSIASSPLCCPHDVHLTVNVVRYELRGRKRGGVCSTYLADRAATEGPVPVFIHRNPSFRPPAPDTPLIMVGPGTGIAPFRGFLQERRATGARGRNWLFFGGQHRESDFLYEEELEEFQRDGILTRLELAWSRDQEHKVYVQHRMLEHARELWRWLEEGAAFYVCGDAKHMARDVDAALHEVIRRAGGLSAEAAAEYVARMRAERRYCRDVY